MNALTYESAHRELIVGGIKQRPNMREIRNLFHSIFECIFRSPNHHKDFTQKEQYNNI